MPLWCREPWRLTCAWKQRRGSKPRSRAYETHEDDQLLHSANHLSGDIGTHCCVARNALCSRQSHFPQRHAHQRKRQSRSFRDAAVVESKISRKTNLSDVSVTRHIAWHQIVKDQSSCEVCLAMQATKNPEVLSDVRVKV